MTTINLQRLSNEQIKQLTDLSNSLSPTQLIWVSGYFSGLLAQGTTTEAASTNSNKTYSFSAATIDKPASKSLTILYGSRTGNGEGVAKQALKNAIATGFEAKLVSMESYKNNDLKNETNLLLIVSTHGEGEAPFQAKSFYDFLLSKRAPRLEKLNYTVLALGDRTYLRFCQTGIEIDNRLAELGGKRILPRVECDVVFRAQALQWVSDSLAALSDTKSDNNTVATSATLLEAESESEFGKYNPYEAQVLEKNFLHGRDSKRQTLHVELSLENSGLSYEPGDSLGVYATNPPELVEHVLQLTQLKATETLTLENGTSTLSDVLFKNYELTQLTPDVLKRYAEHTNNESIKELLQTPESVKEFIYGKDVVDLLTLFPAPINAEQLIALLRPIQPRLYSIASSQQAYPDEVHLTVGVVKYKNGDRKKTGLCSVFLSDRTEENESAPVFIEKNNNFRLPTNTETPIIMVGAGTGVAPYRAFLQQRELDEKRGKNWLIFGNRHSKSEFLYQLEWQRLVKDGVLDRIDVAFSRDTDEKIYVQDRLREQGKLLYQWLEEGAHFYICGDMKKMARDVNHALLEAIQLHGGLSKEAAEAYVLKLQQDKRYQTDVY